MIRSHLVSFSIKEFNAKIYCCTWTIFPDYIGNYIYALCSSIQSLKWAVLVKTPGYCSKPHGTWPHETIPCIVLSPEALGHMSGPPESPWKIDTNHKIYGWFENSKLN